MVNVNLKKTKTMIMQKNARKPQDSLSFHIDNESVNFTQDYSYLGVSITASGNFTLAQEHFKDKAIQAMFALRKYTEVDRLPVKTSHKLFDVLIAPILTYNSEVRGAYVKHDLKSIEKAHFKFYKYYIGVSNKATNLASRAKLDKFPLKILIDQKLLGFVKHLGEMNNNTLTKQALVLSEELRSKKQVCFLTNIDKILKSYDINSIDDFQFLSSPTIKQCVTKMKTSYVNLWQARLVRKIQEDLRFITHSKKNSNQKAI